MESITDEAFRKTILKLYPEWDYLATDFLRVPSAGRYPVKHVVRHFGKNLSELNEVRQKTLFQILTSHRAFTLDLVSDIQSLGYPWLDINLGCPSNTVTKNGGGSSLLKDLKSLAPLMRSIRQNFSGRLTAKVRTGFHDTSIFEDLIKLLNDEGIELITVHARTREMMYKVPAQWEYIKRATEISKVPIIGNGDLWSIQDINRMFHETGCHGVMVARGALRAPWIAQDYRSGLKEEDFSLKKNRIKKFFLDYRTNLEKENISPRGLLKQSKSVSRFMFDDMIDGETIRRQTLLSQTVNEFYSILESI
jgi:tRNA-dihydrouridine synthase B